MTDTMKAVVFKGKDRIAVERVAGFCDAPLEVAAGPVEIEVRVPAAAHPVTRIEFQCSLELPLRLADGAGQRRQPRRTEEEHQDRQHDEQ